MSNYVPYSITTDAGKALWRKVNDTSGSSTWGPLGEAIEAIEREAKADAWQKGYGQGKYDGLYGFTTANPYRGEKQK